MLSRHLTVDEICSTNNFLIFSGLSSGFAVTLQTMSNNGFEKFCVVDFC